MSRDLVDIDVTLAPGWLPVRPVPGVLLAAVAPAADGQVVASLVVRMHDCPGLDDPADAEVVLAAVGDRGLVPGTVRALRWCAPSTVAVLAAAAAPGRQVVAADLARALAQTEVYAISSTGRAISASSAGEASDGCRGSTRTV